MYVNQIKFVALVVVFVVGVRFKSYGVSPRNSKERLCKGILGVL